MMDGMDDKLAIVVAMSESSPAKSVSMGLNAGCNEVPVTTWNSGVGVCSMDVTLNIGVGIVATLVEVVKLDHPVHVSVVMFELDVD